MNNTKKKQIISSVETTGSAKQEAYGDNVEQQISDSTFGGDVSQKASSLPELHLGDIWAKGKYAILVLSIIIAIYVILQIMN